MNGAGKSKAAKRLRVRPETLEDGALVWAGIGASSPIPDRANIETTYTDVTTTGDAIQRHGDPKLVSYEGQSPQIGARLAKEVAGLPSVLYRAGEITVVTPMLSRPSVDPAFGSILDTSLCRMLASGMGVAPLLAASSVTVASAADANTFTVNPAVASLVKGSVVGADFNGRRSAAHVISITGGGEDPQVVKLCSPLARLLAADDTLRLGQVFAIGGPLPLGPSVEFELNGKGWRDIAHGCRWTKAVLQADEGRAYWALTFDAPIILEADDDAEVDDGVNYTGLPRDPYDSEVATLDGTRPTISTSHTWSRRRPPTLSDGLENEVLPIAALSVTINNPMTARGDYDGLGMGPTEPDDPTVEIAVTLSRPLTDFTRDVLRDAAENYRELVLPFGPVGKHGGAIIVPGASLTSDPSKYDEGESFYRTVLTFQCGPNATEGTDVLAAPFKLALF